LAVRLGVAAYPVMKCGRDGGESVAWRCRRLWRRRRLLKPVCVCLCMLSAYPGGCVGDIVAVMCESYRIGGVKKAITNGVAGVKRRKLIKTKSG